MNLSGSSQQLWKGDACHDGFNRDWVPRDCVPHRWGQPLRRKRSHKKGDTHLRHPGASRHAMNPQARGCWCAARLTAQTEYLGLVDAETRAGENGQSFAAIASASTDVRVELRRVAAPAHTALCWGDEPVSYVALAYGEPLTVLSLVAFSGADAPGPNARASTLCATYAYAVD